MPAATQGGMQTSKGVPLPLSLTEVYAQVNGAIADVQVKQVFTNHTNEKIEATYSFPLSHEGSVCRFNFKLGERIIKGVIKEKEEAKKTYEAAKARGQAATLLEQDKENLFTMSVANIKPGEIIEVNMGYQEKIPFDDGEYRFIFPLVATEAYDGTGNTTTTTKGTPNPTPTQSIAASDQRNSKVNVKLTINPGVGIETPKSLSHSVEVTQKDGLYHISLSPTDSIPNRDFVIAYKLVAKEVEPVLYFEKTEATQPGSFVLVVTPPAETPAATHSPMDVLFMVDRSYSMRGGSLAQCARAIQYLVEPLTSEDGVQLVVFDHDIESFDGKAEWEGCSDAVKESMVKFLENTKPRGGTELEYALHAAIEILPQRHSKEKLICLLTDAAIGDLTRAQQLCEKIVQQERTRLYVLGVGPSVDRYAVQQLAKKANGVSEVLLASEKDITGTLDRFRRRLLEAGPAIQNLSIDWDKKSGLELFEFFPASLPDLFTGQPLQVCGQYKGAPGAPVRVTINGNKRDGSKFTVSKEIRFPNEEIFAGHAGVQRTWAKFKIDALSENLSSAANQEEAKFEIIKLSFQNTLMSKFTSFVAEEEDPNEKTIPIKVSQAKAKGPVVIEDLKPSDKAKSILLRAAIAFNAPYTGSALQVGGKKINFSDNTTLISHLDIYKGVELVDSPYQPKIVPKVVSIKESLMGFKSVSVRSSSVMKDKADKKEKSKEKVKSRKKKMDVSEERMAKEAMKDEMISDCMDDIDMDEERELDASSEECDEEMEDEKKSYEKEREHKEESADKRKKKMTREREAMPMSALRKRSEGPARAEPISYERVLIEVKQKEKEGKGWLPKKPWLAPDTKDFLKKQAEKLPEKARPTIFKEGEKYSSEVQEYIKNKNNIGEMDLAFVVDETGSMGSWISKVQQEIKNIIENIQKSPICKDVRVGLVGYRDHPPQDQMVTEVMELTNDFPRIQAGVNEMRASGGGDGPECMTDGMYEAVRLNWRPTAAKVVVLITDAPPHGLPGHRGDGFPTGCPCGRHWYAQAACMREMGVVCYTVGCGISGDTETVYRIIADVTKGLYVNISDVSLLIPLITGAAETALDRQRLQELLLEVVLENLAELQSIEDDESLVTELLKRLRAKNVKLRALSVHTNTMGMHFEDLTHEDVQLAFEDLRRSERVAL